MSLQCLGSELEDRRNNAMEIKILLSYIRLIQEHDFRSGASGLTLSQIAIHPGCPLEGQKPSVTRPWTGPSTHSQKTRRSTRRTLRGLRGACRPPFAYSPVGEDASLRSGALKREIEIYLQEVYWGVSWGSTPVGAEGSRTGQREELNCNATATEASADLPRTLEQRPCPVALC